jgi:hypothetical protein
MPTVDLGPCGCCGQGPCFCDLEIGSTGRVQVSNAQHAPPAGTPGPGQPALSQIISFVNSIDYDLLRVPYTSRTGWSTYDLEFHNSSWSNCQAGSSVFPNDRCTTNSSIWRNCDTVGSGNPVTLSYNGQAGFVGVYCNGLVVWHYGRYLTYTHWRRFTTAQEWNSLCASDQSGLYSPWTHEWFLRGSSFTSAALGTMGPCDAQSAVGKSFTISAPAAKGYWYDNSTPSGNVDYTAHEAWISATITVTIDPK